MDMSLSNLQELATDREAQHAAAHDVAESDTTEWLNWTELKHEIGKGFLFCDSSTILQYDFYPPPF